MVRRKNWGIVQRTPEPPLRNAWRATPETPAPPRPMHLHFAKPPKKFGEMTDEEIDEFAAHFVKGMARQVGRDES
jgi:hypothetical protein